MRERLAVAIMTCITMNVSLLALPVVHPTPPEEGGGMLVYIPLIMDSREADGNMFFSTTETATWTGLLEGESYAECTVVVHSSGLWFYKAVATFEGEVDGKTGTLTLRFLGSRWGTEDWEGKWVILSGTGELAGLKGQGTFWGVGSAGHGYPGDIYYAGKTHFEP